MLNELYDDLQVLYEKQKRLTSYINTNNLQRAQYEVLIDTTQNKKDEIEKKRSQENDAFQRLVMMEQVQDAHVSLKHYQDKVQTFTRRILMAEFQLAQVVREMDSSERILASFFTGTQLEKFLKFKKE